MAVPPASDLYGLRPAAVAALVALAAAGAWVTLGDAREAPRLAIALLLAWGALVVMLRPAGGRPGHVLAAALAVRALLLLAPPSLSDDLFRYLWEGKVVGMGEDPFLRPPADPRWPADPILDRVNHPEISTIYPPFALWLFALLAEIRYAPVTVQAAMGLCDAGLAWALAAVLAGRRRSLAGAWLYALHPLAAVESASSGHLEPAALLCAILAIYAWDRGKPGLLWAGLGAGLKLLPGALLVALWRRKPAHLLVVAAALALASWPFLDAGPALARGFGAYARHWQFNAGLFQVYAALLGEWARPAAVLTGAAVTAAALRWRADPAEVLLWVGGAFVLLSPTVHPWYIAWAWAPALLCGVRAWTVLATLAPLSYAALASYDPATSTWSEPAWPAPAQYLPFLTALLWESARRLTRAGPWAPGPATIPSSSRSPTSPGPSIPAPPSPPSGSGWAGG